MTIDGRAIAEDVYASLVERRTHIKRPITLGIVVSKADPVIESFVRIKQAAAKRLDISIEREDVSDNAHTIDAQNAVRELSSRVDALIVQLPLSPGLDTDAVLSSIPREKDVDAINPTISGSNRPVFSPVALAVAEILQQNHIELRNKQVLIVGEGRLVGRPIAEWFSRQGIEPLVVSNPASLEEHVGSADILVLGAGDPGIVKPEHVKEGVVIIDAGTSEQGGVIRGDADPACADKASIFTPVPGGVGPIAVAMIFKNLLDLVQQESRS